MAQKSRVRLIDQIIFGLSVFLAFCLVFDSFVELPVLVAWLGRWHPVILHFPIVLLLITVFLGLTGKQIPVNLLAIAVISVLVTAISGFFLGKEANVKGDLMFWHQWLGSGLAALAVLWYWLVRKDLQQKIFTKVLQVVLIGMVLFTGHYGGMVTHGEDFLALPNKKRLEKIPENPLIYQDIVGRILDDRCVSCHNPNKKKGELVMTGINEMLKGGEAGNTLVVGDPENSEMIKRLHLPLEEEEHMPPEGKKQLDGSEIQILERWIALGASDTLRLNHLTSSEPLAALINDLMQPDPMEQWAKLPQVADSTIQRLSSDYLTISRMAGNSNALSVDVFSPPEYDANDIISLKRVATNIVELDVSGLPIGKSEVDEIATFQNLEWLEIDKTPIGDVEFEALKTLQQLKLLKIFETNITDQSIAVVKSLQNLKSLYLWETGVSEDAMGEMIKEMPSLQVEAGIDEEVRTFFVANDSIPKAEEENK